MLSEMLGRRFGMLTVLSDAGFSKPGTVSFQHQRIVAVCDCGVTRNLNARSVWRGRTKSCGCLHKIATSTHGLERHPFYARWRCMISRCYNESDIGYHRYGGRGIYVCDEWKDSPEAYIEWAVKNGLKPGLQVDRSENDGPYSPDNCVVATVKQNSRNRRTTFYVTVDGVRMPVQDAAEMYGVAAPTIIQRIKRLNWSDDEAVKTPALIRPSRVKAA